MVRVLTPGDAGESEALVQLAQRLEESGPVRPQGVALAHLLLSEPGTRYASRQNQACCTRWRDWPSPQ